MKVEVEIDEKRVAEEKCLNACIQSLAKRFVISEKSVIEICVKIACRDWDYVACGFDDKFTAFEKFKKN